MSRLTLALILSLGACAHARPRAPKPAPQQAQPPAPPSHVSADDAALLRAQEYEVQAAIAEIQRSSLLLERLRAQIAERYRIDLAHGDDLGEVQGDGRMPIKRKAQ